MVIAFIIQPARRQNRSSVASEIGSPSALPSAMTKSGAHAVARGYTKRQLFATRGIVTRIKNRVGHGVLLHACNRTFGDLYPSHVNQTSGLRGGSRSEQVDAAASLTRGLPCNSFYPSFPGIGLLDMAFEEAGILQ